MVRAKARWLAVVSVLVVPLGAGAALRVSGTPDVKFTALGPAGLRITGATHDLTVADDGTNLTVRVPLKRLTTGIRLRDDHLKRDLDVSHYPLAVLTVPKNGVRVPGGDEVSGTVRGSMQLHGRTHAVSLRYTAERDDGAIDVDGKVRVHMPDFGIEIPPYMGMTVRPDVDVEVSFTVLDH